jgi:predicted kinase
MSAEARALLLIGTMGSGKTTVMLEVGRLLSDRGEAHALVDLDWLAWVEPPTASSLRVRDMLVANLAAVAATFRLGGIHELVLARHVTQAQELAAIEAAVAHAELAVVRLEAPEALIEARIRARDTGRELEEHLAALGAEATPEFPYRSVANDGRPPAEVAREVLRAAGWE